MEAVIIIFLLFFAVLAFGWFYLQRAKARDAALATDPAAPTAPTDTAAAAAPAAFAPVEPAETEAPRTDATAS